MIRSVYQLTIAVALAAVSQNAYAMDATHRSFEGILPSDEVLQAPVEGPVVGEESVVDLVGYHSCGDGCCGDSCCGCCSSCCCSGAAKCCKPNCGLLGQGVLTYDACSCGCPLTGNLLGCFACRTDDCFNDFITPMTNFVFFEDPRQTTELRAVFLQHKVPGAALGGDIQLYALQIRARLADGLSLIATKDGYAVSSNPLIDDGWGDVGLGLKYSLMRDVRNQRLLSTGFVYEMPVGSPRTQQGRGDGVFHLFLTGGTQVCDCGHWVSNFGGIVPIDGDENSSFIYWSNHFDYQFRRGWYALLEFNWYHWVSDGTGGIPGTEGSDLFNFGSTGVEGDNIVTGAFGMKYKPNRKTEIGIAWENPLTTRRYVTENRLTVDWVMRY